MQNHSSATSRRSLRQVYNQLPMLEDATAEMKHRQKDFNNFIKEGDAILSKFDFANGEIGAFLLHRHWELAGNSIMIERPRVLQSGKVGLVTYAERKSAVLTSGAKPSRWMALSNSLIGLEYSVDPHVITIANRLSKSKKLIALLTDLLRKHHLENHVGYMVVPRKSLSSQQFRDFVEDNEGNVSVTTGQNLTRARRRKVIRTGWSFSRRGRKAGYCVHTPDYSCKHSPPDPPVCSPHGCVKPVPGSSTTPRRRRRKRPRRPPANPRVRK